ncbi:MAG: hypothetical protein WCO45_00410 [Pseudanabaena sp. ELA607]
MISAIYMFPIPGGDAIAFVPAAVSYSAGNGLKNIIYLLSFITDVQHQGRFSHYPPLFPWLVGALMPHHTVQAAFFILGLFSLISIGIFTFLLLKIVKLYRSYINYDSAIVVSLMIFSYSSLILPMSGRPELLAAIFVLSGAAIFAFGKGEVSAILLGVSLGFLGATHIAAAIISTVILLLGYSYRYRSKKVIQLFLISTLVALAITVTLIAVSPNGFVDTLVGINLTAKMQLERTDTGLFMILNYWVFSVSSFFFGPIIIFSFLSFVYRSFQTYRDNGTTTIYWICLLSLAYLFYFFGFRAAPISYNFTLFQPIAYCMLLLGLFQNKSSKSGDKLMRQDKRKIAYKNIVLLMLLISLVSPLRTSFLFVDYVASGKTYENARNQAKAILSGGKHMLFTGNMWTLSDEYEKMSPWDITVRNHSGNPEVEVILLQQEAGTSHFAPENGTLVADWRYFKQPLIFGIPLGNRPQGYSFSAWAIANSGKSNSGK